MYGLEPSGTTANLLDGPLALQEMAFALWLLVKGFDRAALATEPVQDPAIAPAAA